MQRRFSHAEARALLPELLVHADLVVRLRAELASAQAAVRRGEPPDGGLAEAKALEAHLQEAVDWFAANGVELKGIAPLVADFPIELDGDLVLLCWLEGEQDLRWYHPVETGFMGRRRLPEAALGEVEG